MQLVLTDQEAVVLRGLFEAYLPELRREVARTEDHGLRHELVRRRMKEPDRDRPAPAPIWRKMA